MWPRLLISPQVGRLAHKRGVPAPQVVKIEEKYGMRYYTFMARLIAEQPLPAQVLFKEEEEVSKEKVCVSNVYRQKNKKSSFNHCHSLHYLY